MSMASMIVEGLTATIIGMGIVFAVLALLAVILSFFKYLNPEAKKAAVMNTPEAGTVEEASSQIAEAEDEPVNAQDDSVLVAVISAALAAYMGDGTAVPVIKSITPVTETGRSKAWNIAAIRENHRGLY